MLFLATRDFGDDIWEVVKASGKEAWPKAKGIAASLENYEVVCAPPGCRAGGQIFQRNINTGTERSVRRLVLSYGSLVGSVEGVWDNKYESGAQLATEPEGEKIMGAVESQTAASGSAVVGPAITSDAVM